ncbi:MAG: NUDIX domain-containing protein [Clostridia bacterium]|nr:NUDIX domain-containing protein [Clostridia bacterium]
MEWEYSCGAVVFTRRGGQILYLIAQEQSGAYSFPKGHMEPGETEEETARREIFEETGLRPELIGGFVLRDEYSLAERPGTSKRVTYFLAQFGSETPTAAEGEIRRLLLLPYAQALALFPHEGCRRILRQAHALLTERQ